VQTFILHGDAVDGGEVLRSAVESALARHIVPSEHTAVRVLLSENPNDVGLLGAAGIVLRQHFGVSA
jgi:glucokinase